eukprot:9186359-Pyramimonas_sp.AAC.1
MEAFFIGLHSAMAVLALPAARAVISLGFWGTAATGEFSSGAILRAKNTLCDGRSETLTTSIVVIDGSAITSHAKAESGATCTPSDTSNAAALSLLVGICFGNEQPIGSVSSSTGTI